MIHQGITAHYKLAQQERRIYTIYIAPVLNAEFHFHMSETYRNSAN